MKKAGQIAGKIIVWILGGVVAVFCAIRLFYIFAGTATGLAAAAYVIVRAILKLWPYLLAAAAIAGAVLAVRGYIRKRKDETAQKLEATYKEGSSPGCGSVRQPGKRKALPKAAKKHSCKAEKKATPSVTPRGTSMRSTRRTASDIIMTIHR